MFNLLINLQGIDDPYEKINKLKCLVYQFNTEMMKIDAFKKELPLCVSMLNAGT